MVHLTCPSCPLENRELRCWLDRRHGVAYTASLPSPKRLYLRAILSDWPPSRESASAKQVSQLVGVQLHVSFAFRPGSFFLQRMLASVGMPRTAAGADYTCRAAKSGRRAVLGPKFHGDLEF